jgi:hypothetical protein
METVLILATLLRAVTLHSVPGKPVVLEAGVTLGPKHGIWQQLRFR